MELPTTSRAQNGFHAFFCVIMSSNPASGSPAPAPPRCSLCSWSRAADVARSHAAMWIRTNNQRWSARRTGWAAWKDQTAALDAAKRRSTRTVVPAPPGTVHHELHLLPPLRDRPCPRAPSRDPSRQRGWPRQKRPGGAPRISGRGTRETTLGSYDGAAEGRPAAGGGFGGRRRRDGVLQREVFLARRREGMEAGVTAAASAIPAAGNHAGGVHVSCFFFFSVGITRRPTYHLAVAVV